MMVPAIAFALGLIVFGTIGLAILKLWPSLGLTALNLLAFVVGGFVGSLLFSRASSTVLGRTIAGRGVVIGYILGVFLAGVLGGVGAVRLARRLRRAA